MVLHSTTESPPAGARRCSQCGRFKQASDEEACRTCLAHASPEERQPIPAFLLSPDEEPQSPFLQVRADFVIPRPSELYPTSNSRFDARGSVLKTIGSNAAGRRAGSRHGADAPAGAREFALMIGLILLAVLLFQGVVLMSAS